ncbi:hypothetical protein ADK38_05310, partial [Streptomyces varsoviensis]
RLATDLQLWSTQEFAFIAFPERLVGGSSAMPQKRNAFLLEHVKAKAGVALGAWTAAAATMKSTPFTNSIEVGTEAVGPAWGALHTVTESVLLAQVLVSGARPEPERMARRADEGFVTATILANRLVREGVPFRTAHHVVGAAVREAVEAGATELRLPPGTPGAERASLPPLGEVVAEHDRGGGPGMFDTAFATTRARLAEHADWLRGHRERLDAARHELLTSVSKLVDGTEQAARSGGARDD